jgi:hypothetical protein
VTLLKARSFWFCHRQHKTRVMVIQRYDLSRIATLWDVSWCISVIPDSSYHSAYASTLLPKPTLHETKRILAARAKRFRVPDHTKQCKMTLQPVHGPIMILGRPPCKEYTSLGWFQSLVLIDMCHHTQIKPCMPKMAKYLPSIVHHHTSMSS